MKKRIFASINALALVACALTAHAQTYPSPTFQNTTVLGTLTAANSTLSGGAINGMSVGATTPSTGAFTTLSTTGLATLNGLSLTGSPLAVASGGTSCSSASGTCLDNITGFSGTGFLSRTGAGTYSFTTNIPVTAGGTGLTSLTQYSTLVGNGTGNVSLIAPGTANYAYLSNGASANPSFQQLTAPMVNYTSSLTGATTRTQASKDGDVVSVMDFGADNTCTNDAAPAFRQAAASVNYGGTVLIPWGCYLLNSYTNNAIIDFTSFPNKGITWQGVGWTLKTGGSFSFGTGTGPQGSILRIGSSIPNTVDFFHQAPNDLVIGGVAFKDFAIVASTGAYGTPHGQNGFNFDGSSGGYIENLVMDDVFIDNFASGSSILVNGIGNAQGVLAGAEFRNSKFMNFYAPGFGDSNTIRNNVIGANAGTTGAVGINFYNVSGATNTRILNNDMVNLNGMILVNGCTKCIIDGNEFEQPAGFANTLGAMISFNGANGVIDTPTITNNSISQNSAVANYVPLVVGNSNGAKISGNRISTLSAYNQIQINSNSSYTLVDADNQSWVGGVLQSYVPVTNSGTKSMLRGQPWTSYTPTVSASSGTFTSVTATGSYQLINPKTVEISEDITINTVGTASGSVYVTLPAGFTAAANQALTGREHASTGDGLSADILTGSGTMTVTNASGGSIIGAGYHLLINGTMQIQ